MLDWLIPPAKAQSVFDNAAQTAENGAEVVADGAQGGIQSFISYVANNIDNWIAGIIIVFVFYIIARMSAASIKKTMISKREDIQESALILVDRITKITIITIGITIAFAINGLNFTTVLGALSLGIGFALKDIIGNFISGVIMLSQSRINIGDFIRVGEILGTIVNIDTRATILQGIDGTEIVIPNQTMLGETLISYTTNPFRRIDLMVGVDYKTDLPMVTSLIKGIIDKDENIVVKPEPLILVDEFGDSAINIKIKFWIETGNSWMKIRSNLANKIKHAFDEVGVNIPFPIRTLKLDEDDRSFLKTMDSLKKGVVPELKKTPSNEEIAHAATKAGQSQNIPFPIFGDSELEGRRVEPEDLDAGPIQPPTQNTIPQTAPTPTETTPTNDIKAPPTHL